ncbi:hypothetical protein Btru_068885 [Bulinus truncatus]|nr:hypothetical protein Btru_068885 [Bulinus truncatus]
MPDISIKCQKDLDKSLDLERICVEEANRKREKQDRYDFLAKERKLMGLPEPSEEEKNKVPLYARKTTNESIQEKLKLCPPIDMNKIAQKRKTMRMPARKLCMLNVPHFSPPEDDYNDLSNFLRISTMPGYSSNDYISTYKDTHNMSVWNTRKDIDRQAFKLTRDWLSTWSEYDVIERRWRKAWAEKFSA